jgi:hypothetical protein
MRKWGKGGTAVRAFLRYCTTLGQRALGRESQDVNISCVLESEFFNKVLPHDGIGILLHIDRFWYVVEGAGVDGDDPDTRLYYIYWPQRVVVRIRYSQTAMRQAVADVKAKRRLPKVFRQVERARIRGERYVSAHKEHLRALADSREADSYFDPPVVIATIDDQADVFAPMHIQS